MKKRLASVAVVFAMLFAFFPADSLQTYAAGSADLKVQYHSIQQINAFAASHPADLAQTVTFSKKPSISYPYAAGRLSDETMKSALNLVNQIRYIAGIPSNLTLDEDYIELAQTATVLASTDEDFERSDDMDEDFYTAGLVGAFSSNMSWGAQNLNKAILSWMDDRGSESKDTLDNRRCILYPNMKATGFGSASKYHAMYIMDDSEEAGSFSNIAWPAQNTPVEYFSGNNAWSISTGREVDKANVNVVLTRKSDNKTWNFSSSHSDGTFYVNNDEYDLIGCIIFKPSNLEIKSGDRFSVKVTGAGSDINYDVNFFNLGSSTDVTDPTSSSSTNVTESTTVTTSSSTESSTSASTTKKTTAAPKYEVLVTGNNVNVRSGAGTNYGVVTSVKKGQKLTYLGEKTVNGKKWYNVEVNGKKGWIISTYSKLVSASSQTTATTAKPTATSKTASTTNKTTATTVTPKYEVLVTGNNVNVRSGAGTNYGVVTSVKKGQKLTYLGEKTVNGKKWYNVEVNGKKGWIISTYSKLVSASSQTTATTAKPTATSKTASTTKKTTATTVTPKYEVLVTGNNVNVRSGAGTNYGVVTSVKKGQKLTYLGEKTANGKKWYNVEVNGKKGWIIGTYSKLVSASSQTTAVKDSYVIITGSAVNVRSGAGTNYSVVTAVYKGQKFKYSDVKTVDKTKWYKITVNGTTGWVAGTYVKVSN